MYSSPTAHSPIPISLPVSLRSRRYLEEGLHIGLGTDIAGGHSLSMLRAIADAIQVSKLRWRLVDDSHKPLSLEEAFYMATMGGGAFFGKVGTFAEGYEFDALILDDSSLRHPQPLTARERLERLIYLSDDQLHHRKIYFRKQNLLVHDNCTIRRGYFYES